MKKIIVMAVMLLPIANVSARAEYMDIGGLGESSSSGLYKWDFSQKKSTPAPKVKKAPAAPKMQVAVTCKCQYCGVTNNHETGVCDNCGAPLSIEDEVIDKNSGDSVSAGAKVSVMEVVNNIKVNIKNDSGFDKELVISTLLRVKTITLTQKFLLDSIVMSADDGGLDYTAAALAIATKSRITRNQESVLLWIIRNSRKPSQFDFEAAFKAVLAKKSIKKEAVSALMDIVTDAYMGGGDAERTKLFMEILGS